MAAMDGDPTTPRPDRPEYYMSIALAVRARANCIGNRVGAILVLGDRIIATGYNGTPSQMTNCDEGGCERCANREKYRTSAGYDVCICVHAEQNTILSAARFGIAVAGADLYTTMQPCFGCAKELLQAQVRSVRYLHPWQPSDAELLRQYRVLLDRFPGGVMPVRVPDPAEKWAVSRLREATLDTGHAL
jgi:dCMP deaminase